MGGVLKRSVPHPSKKLPLPRQLHHKKQAYFTTLRLKLRMCASTIENIVATKLGIMSSFFSYSYSYVVPHLLQGSPAGLKQVSWQEGDGL